MIGLALEGGGIKGSYQAGVFAAMYEVGLKIDGVCGTSIGAINAAIIASNKGYMLPQIWRSLNIGHVFGFSDELVNALNSKKIDSKLIKLLIAASLYIVTNKGIELSGVKEILDEYVDIAKIKKNKMDFGLCTLREKDLMPLYLFKEDMGDNINDYIIASCSLPIFHRQKMIDDNYYLDGGFYDLGPVNMLLKKGYKTVYLVKVHGPGIRREYPADANVIVIESKRSLGRVLDFDPNRIEENIKMGYYDALRVLKNYDGEKYVFQRKSLKYYQRLNREVSKHLLHRLKVFFKTSNVKETTIKALEYTMERVNMNYYAIYRPAWVIKYLQKNYERDYFIFNYLKKLKPFI